MLFSKTERYTRVIVSLQQVRASMDEGEGQLDKIDNTPVTIADFGVQALVSLGTCNMPSNP